MSLGLGAVCYAMAVILALLAAIPPLPGSGPLLALSLMFISLGHLV